MSTAGVIYRIYDLPWTTGSEQEAAFKRLVRRVAVVSLILAIVLSLLPVPEPDPDEVREVPERFARLLIEQPPPQSGKDRLALELLRQSCYPRLFR